MMTLAEEDGKEEAEVANDYGWMDGMGKFVKEHHIWALRFHQSSHHWAPICDIFLTFY